MYFPLSIALGDVMKTLFKATLLYFIVVLNSCSLFERQPWSFEGNLQRAGHTTIQKNDENNKTVKNINNKYQYYTIMLNNQFSLLEEDPNGVISLCTFDGDTTCPGCYPYAFSDEGNTYIVVFVQTGYTTITTKFFLKSIESKDGYVTFTNSEKYDTSSIFNYFSSLKSTYKFIRLSSPCIYGDTMYFTVLTSKAEIVGPVTCSIYQSKISNNKFSTPTKIKGAMPTRFQNNWIGKLYISRMGDKAYFTILNVPLHSFVSELNSDSIKAINNQRGVFPFVAVCDIDANGEFGNTYISALPENINNENINFLCDVTTDNGIDTLYVCHFNIAGLTSFYGQDGYVADALYMPLETLPNWVTHGKMDLFTLIE